MRILVVEDEAIIRTGLVKHLPWKQMGIEKVCAVRNAEEAFAVSREFHPDIVLSDIQMPGMNGVQMCRELSECYPEMQIIFLTGYVEKEYLKAAIDLRAVSYLEKPVSLPKVQEAVRQAVENIEKEKIRKEAVLHQILMNSEEAGRHLGKISWCQVFLVHLQKREDVTNVRALVEHSGILERHTKLLKLMDLVSPRTIALLVGTTDKERVDVGKQMATLLEQAQIDWNGGWFLAAGKVGDAVEKIPESYQTAEEVLKSLSYYGWNGYARYPEEQTEYRNTTEESKMLEIFGHLVSGKKFKAAAEMLEDFYHELIERKVVLGYSVYHVTRQFLKVMAHGRAHVPGMKKALEERAEQNLLPEEVETLKELCTLLKKQLNYLMIQGKTDEQEEMKSNFIVQKVIEYMYQNYADPDLSIKVLADQVYLTPTYLSNLFKKQTGVTIGQYMTDLRMEEAKCLLKDPQYKLYQISELTGYKDPNYFARIFKKKTGYTPSEYREETCL